MGGAAAMRAQGDDLRETLLARAREAAKRAYAPYSRFPVGAALAFADGAIVTGANAENASYGLSLCAETAAAVAALNAGRRGGLVAVAVVGGAGEGPVITPCGRCRQVLSELAQSGLESGEPATDPLVWCAPLEPGAGAGPGGEEGLELRLSVLLPHAFSLSPGNR